MIIARKEKFTRQGRVWTIDNAHIPVSIFLCLSIGIYSLFIL